MEKEQTKLERCAGCGKEIGFGEEVYLIQTGRMKKNSYEFKRKSEWGKMHKNCFILNVNSSKDFIAHLESLIKS